MIDSSEDLEEKTKNTLQLDAETNEDSTKEIENINTKDQSEVLVSSPQLDKTEEKPKVSQKESDIHTNSPTNTGAKFYDDLRTVIKTQENILITTSMAREKIKYANEISIDQLKNFKDSSLKYGKYLKLIHEELAQVGDLMKKIKKEIK